MAVIEGLMVTAQTVQGAPENGMHLAVGFLSVRRWIKYGLFLNCIQS